MGAELPDQCRKGADGVWADHVKVVDFGLAKIGGATSLTDTGVVAGTPGYMSPEQAMGDELDARTDVYACGVTLYRLLAGHMPFPGERLAAVLGSKSKPRSRPRATFERTVPPIHAPGTSRSAT